MDRLAQANPAVAIYKKLAAARWIPDEALMAQWADEGEWNKIEDNLNEAFDELSDSAGKEVEQSTNDATMWRYVAWIFTAIGALLIGDWKKLLAGPDAGGGEEATDLTDTAA